MHAGFRWGSSSCLLCPRPHCLHLHCLLPTLITCVHGGRCPLQRAAREAVRLHKEQPSAGGAADGPATSAGGGGSRGTTPPLGAASAADSATGGGGGGGGGASKGPKQTEAKLDFFGAEVRAQELLDVLRQWRLVESKLTALPEPLAENFKLSNSETPPLTQARSVWWLLLCVQVVGGWLVV